MKKLQLLLTIVTIVVLSCCYSTASAQLYGPNLIVNGDFADGYADFYTDYVFVDPEVGDSNSLVPEGRFTVAGDPGDFHPNFTGSPFTGENFLIVNGATDAEICGEDPCDDTWIVWQQTVEVEEDKEYELSFMLSSLVSTAPANLNVSVMINNTPYTEIFIAPGATNEWFQKTWTNTDKSQTATITIIETTKVESGNDFGIDDIVFRSVEPQPAPCPELDVEINITDVTCPGEDDGIIEVIMDGVKPFNICISAGCEEEGDDYEILDKSQTATYGGLLPGYYTITIFDGNGCPFEACVYVGEPEPLAAEIVNLVNPLCYGDENGWVEMEISGGTPPYTADMGTVDGNMLTIDGLGDGAYSVEIDDSNGCGSIDVSFDIEEPTLLEADYEATEILCYGDFSTVTVTATGGTPPYQLFDGETLVDDFDNGMIDVPAQAGSFNWTVVDANGCETDVDFVIDQPDQPYMEVSIDDILCNGGEAEVAISISGGTPPYTVNIEGFEPIEENGTFVFMLPAGSYVASVYDANQCDLGSIDFEVTEPDLLEANYETDEIACYGEEAEVTVFAMGGTPPYELFDGDAFAGDFEEEEISLMVGAGEYLWTIVDANGCEAEVEFEMTQPDPLVAELTETMDATCYGYEDGMALISVTGGTMPYSADMGTFDEGLLTLEGLGADEYTVVITDAKNCGPEEITFEIGQPDEIVIENVDTDIPLCAPDNFPLCTEPWAVAVVDYNVGTSTYGDGTVAESRTDPLNALGMPDYSNSPPITYVTLGFGGDIILEVECLIYNGEGDDFEVVETSYGGPDCDSYPEKADVLVAQEPGGPWSYLGEICRTDGLDLSNGVDPDTEESFVLEWAKYVWIVDVSDEEDFSNGDGYDVNGITIFNVFEEPFQTDASITINYSGAEDGEEIEFVIYDGEEVVSISNVAELSGLNPGTYTVVLQVGECFSEPFEFTVPEFPEPIVANAEVTDVDCNGEATGAAQVTVSGGTAPYTLTWAGLEEPVVIEEDGGTYLITGLPAGSYTIEIIDDNGCIEDYTFTVGEPPLLTAEVETGEILCFGGDTEVDLTIEGGVEPYLLSDNNSEFELEIDEAGTTPVSGLLAADYSWTVTDNNGCAVLVEFTLDQPDPIVAEESYDPIECYGYTTDVTVTASGGFGPYMLYDMEVDEDNLVIPSFDTEVTLNELGGGSYFWIVVDENGCEFILEFEIEEPEEFTADYVLDPESILCHNGVTTALVSAQGGTPPYFLTLGEGNVIEFTDEYIVEDVAPGFYSWIVTDANGCNPQELDFELENPDEIILTVDELTHITCYGYDDGEIHASAYGGTGVLNFSINDGEPQESGSFYNLVAGDYVVTVTDENGCFATEVVTLEEPDELVIDVYDIVPADYGENNGEIWAMITGGTGPYNVCLFTECVENGEEEGEVVNKSQGVMYWDLEPGEYMIRVVDANGCIAYVCVDVPELEDEKIVLSANNNPDADDILITYPNPFKNQTTVTFTPQTSQFVSLEVYNVIGERIEILFQGDVNAFEEQQHVFRAKHLPNGIYYVRLTMDNTIHFNKIILTR